MAWRLLSEMIKSSNTSSGPFLREIDILNFPQSGGLDLLPVFITEKAYRMAYNTLRDAKVFVTKTRGSSRGYVLAPGIMRSWSQVEAIRDFMGLPLSKREIDFLFQLLEASEKGEIITLERFDKSFSKRWLKKLTEMDLVELRRQKISRMHPDKKLSWEEINNQRIPYSRVKLTLTTRGNWRLVQNQETYTEVLDFMKTRFGLRELPW